jgi:hypothetical protein
VTLQAGEAVYTFSNTRGFSLQMEIL